MESTITKIDHETVQNGHDESVVIIADDDSEATIDATNGATTRSEQLVPVSEAKRYRKRAQSAEKQVSDLQQELEHSRQELAERDQDLAQIKRRQAIDAALHEHGAIDSETARVVLEKTIDGDEEKDVHDAVNELARRKPFLFKPAKRTRSATTLGPRPDGGIANAKLEHAAAEAITTGKRSDVLKYLRLRRKT